MNTRSEKGAWAAVRGAAVLAVLTLLAACGGGGGNAGPPNIITLPVGFQPEGIAISGNMLYTGSIPTGRIYRADITTGEGQIVVDPPAGRSAIGMKIDGQGRIFVAGGATGQAYVYDGSTGAELALYTLATGTAATFINDVILTPQAAWFTDSQRPVLYKAVFGANGALPRPQQGAGDIVAVPLTGAFQFIAGQTNANGIAATPDGSVLIIVQSNVGRLYTVNAATGATLEIDLGAETVVNGDGILLQGSTLYVVQNRLNQVAVLTLAANLRSATVVGRATNPFLDVPTTVAASGGSLYLPNARFGTVSDNPSTPEVETPDTVPYTVIRIDKP